MEQETVKLLNVLRRISRAAGYTAWTKPGPDATQFLIAQYNRVLTRLTELEPAIKPLFTSLNEAASPEVIRIAARELLTYFEADESEDVRAFGRAFYFGCRPRRGRAGCVPISVTCE
jgi:hypothetical protein